MQLTAYENDANQVLIRQAALTLNWLYKRTLMNSCPELEESEQQISVWRRFTVFVEIKLIYLFNFKATYHDIFINCITKKAMILYRIKYTVHEVWEQ